MDRPIRILIASASAGTGHLAAAEALRAALLEADPGCAVEHVDVLRLGPSWVRAAYGDGFELVAARAPRVWREIYTRTDGRVDAARWGAAAHRLLFPPFRRLLVAGWDAVLCTHFLPCQLAAGRAGVPPFALVATDRTVHRYWAQQRVTRFFVASGAMAAEVRRRLPGVDATPTGIPVHPRFSRAPDRGAARQELGLPGASPVLLVMGGGLGIGVAETARAVIAAVPQEARILVVTGSNERALRELAPEAAASSRVRVLGRVDNVPTLMSAADLVVTKPGGLTTSEALALGRPLLLTRAIPGHEEGNAQDLVQAGAAVYAPDELRLVQALRSLRDPTELLRMAAAARSLGRPGAAWDVAVHMLHHLHYPRVA